ncbi:MAG: hypothetical protein JKY32_04525 [Rhizobiales bacterium]|nr:hypothetical protein [Hyphomicrobiales bacterium]
MHKRIEHLVDELKTITSSGLSTEKIIEAVRPLVKDLADNPDWVQPEYRTCKSEQGFGVHLLHEQEDHTLAILVAAWLPGFGIPPHNHGTWSVVAGIEGVERNYLWDLVEHDSKTGHAKIVETSHLDLGPGDIMSNKESDIHSIKNLTDEVTLSLHVYGKNINNTERYGYDPEANSFARLTVKIE